MTKTATAKRISRPHALNPADAAWQAQVDAHIEHQQRRERGDESLTGIGRSYKVNAATILRIGN